MLKYLLIIFFLTNANASEFIYSDWSLGAHADTCEEALSKLKDKLKLAVREKESILRGDNSGPKYKVTKIHISNVCRDVYKPKMSYYGFIEYVDLEE